MSASRVLLLVAVISILMTLCHGGGDPPGDVVDPKKAKDENDEGLTSRSEVDVPEALDDEVCDELWQKAKEQEGSFFVDEITEWENLCAMKHGLCELGEPYWTVGLLHSHIHYYYKHDQLIIKTAVSNTMDERCSRPEVNWEKIGEKYRLKKQLKELKPHYKRALTVAAKRPREMVGKRRHMHPV